MSSKSMVTVVVAGMQSSRITYQGRVVCLTHQLAQFYSCSIRNITDNFQRNPEHFLEGVHFIKLTGKALSDLRNLYPAKSGVQISLKTRSLILWSAAGAARHAKLLKTATAWHVFGEVESTYFQHASWTRDPFSNSHEVVRQAAATLASVERLTADFDKKSAELAQAESKVDFVNRYVSASGDLLSFRQVAKLLGVKEADFRDFLQEQKIMYRLGKGWIPYERHLTADRFENKVGISRANRCAFTQVFFTPKGFVWIAKRLREYGGQTGGRGAHVEP